jgi:molybdopterin synthase catalytic subunit/molybdopterin converting factor small subunit
VTYEIHVQYFAAARDLAGCSEERIALAQAEISPAELLRHLGQRHARLLPYLARMRLAVNDELHAQPVTIQAGDRVALLPPVAGGSAPLCAVRDTPLSIDEAVRAVSHAGAGGIALFLGVVRDHAAQGPVARLDYEAHVLLAEKELRHILDEIAGRHAGTRLCVLHRVGALSVGEITVVVAASAPHRAQAFAACREAIDQVKESVPIWKKEWAPDGTALWVNLEG